MDSQKVSLLDSTKSRTVDTLFYNAQSDSIAFYLEKAKYSTDTTNAKDSPLAINYYAKSLNLAIEQIQQLKEEHGIAHRKAAVLQAITFFLSLAFCLIIAIFYWRQQKQLNALRAQLMRDLHDNLGSSLNQIKMLASRLYTNKADATIDSAAALSQIKLLSIELISNMQSLINSIDTQSAGTVADLIQYMRDYANNIFLPLDLPFRMKVNTQNESKVIKPQVSKHIFALFKESINNITKHTRPEIVLINIDIIKNKMKIRIENDKKVLLNSPFSTKKGLKNIEDRVAILKGKMEIKESKDKFILELWVNI